MLRNSALEEEIQQAAGDAMPPENLVLRRQLSASYADPVTGRLTNDDPASYQGRERVIRENALLRDLPDTGYADGIRERRQAEAVRARGDLKVSTFFSESKSINKNSDDFSPAFKSKSK